MFDFYPGKALLCLIPKKSINHLCLLKDPLKIILNQRAKLPKTTLPAHQ